MTVSCLLRPAFVVYQQQKPLVFAPWNFSACFFCAVSATVITSLRSREKARRGETVREVKGDPPPRPSSTQTQRNGRTGPFSYQSSPISLTTAVAAATLIVWYHLRRSPNFLWVYWARNSRSGEESRCDGPTERI